MLRVTETVEPEWDDETRNQALGWDRYNADLCPGCHMHPVVLEDFENQHLTFEERFCPACADQARYGRVVAERDDQAMPKDRDGRPKATAREPRPDDGRHIYVRPMTPDEIERLEERRRARRR